MNSYLDSNLSSTKALLPTRWERLRGVCLAIPMALAVALGAQGCSSSESESDDDTGGDTPSGSDAGSGTDARSDGNAPPPPSNVVPTREVGAREIAGKLCVLLDECDPASLEEVGGVDGCKSMVDEQIAEKSAEERAKPLNCTAPQYQACLASFADYTCAALKADGKPSACDACDADD